MQANGRWPREPMRPQGVLCAIELNLCETHRHGQPDC